MEASHIQVTNGFTRSYVRLQLLSWVCVFSVVYCSCSLRLFFTLPCVRFQTKDHHSHNTVQTHSTYQYKVLASLDPGSWLPLAALFLPLLSCFHSLRPHLPQVTTPDGGRKCRPEAWAESFLLCFTSHALAVVLLVVGRRAEGQRWGHSDCCLFCRLFREGY